MSFESQERSVTYFATKTTTDNGVFFLSLLLFANRPSADWPKNLVTTFKMIFMGKCVLSFQKPSYQWISVVCGLPLHVSMPSFSVTAFSQIDGVRLIVSKVEEVSAAAGFPPARLAVGPILEMPEVQLCDNLTSFFFFFVWKNIS